ncbi:hypothetical protein CDD83_10616 [Cordyceps sp. RAO-2017]|nr:hypothetical protein CDD83_10616 [Cordyceps sp. RAO-2017]
MERGDGAVQTSDRVVCLPCDLASKTLGLSEEDRQGVLHEATVFIHSAWAVNFNIRLESFEDQIAGTRSLIEAAAESCAPLFFISSTAAVSRTASPTVFETVSEDISDASPLGYAQSKWVAERVCAAANDRFSRAASSPDPARPGRVSIIRVGQLCGDEAGVWNASEAYPLLLSTAAIAGCLPSIAGEALDWMPVELAARSVLEIVSAGRAGTRLNGSDSRSYEDGEPDGGPSAQTRVYHVLNPHKSPTWEHMLHWLSADPGGRPFQVVSPATWLARLEAALDGRKPSHPSEALLGLWRDKFGQEPDGKAAAGATRVPVFSVALAQDVSPTMRGLKPLGRQRLAEMWKWVCGNVG